MIPKHYKLKDEGPHHYEIQDERDGKSFKIAKSGLDLDMHGKLSKIKKMAEGGTVQEAKTLGGMINYPGAPKENPKPRQYDEGGDVEDPESEEPANASEETASAPDETPAPDSVAPVSQSELIAAAVPGDGAPPLVAEPIGQGADVPQIQPVDRKPASSSSQTPQSAASSSYQAQKEATQDIGKAEKEQGVADVKSIESVQKQIDEMPTQQEIADKYNAKSAALQKAIAEQKIDPNRFWNNKSTGAKVSAAIGMLFSGIGSGLTGQPNMAEQIIHNSIEKDIDSQKNDQSKNMNLWKMNREAMGSDQAANLSTQNQMYAGLKYDIMKHAAAAGGQINADKAKQASALIDQQMNLNNIRLSYISPQANQAAANGSEQDYVNHLKGMEIYAPEQYKDVKDKYIPGVGTTRVPLTEADRGALVGYDRLQKAIQEAKEFQQTVGTTFPGSTNNDLAKDKAAEIKLQLNNLYKLRPNDTILKEYSEMTPTIGAVRGGKTLAILDNMANHVNSFKDTLHKSLGVMPFKQAPQDSTAVQWAKSNISDPRAAKILQANGIR